MTFPPTRQGWVAIITWESETRYGIMYLKYQYAGLAGSQRTAASLMWGMVFVAQSGSLSRFEGAEASRRGGARARMASRVPVAGRRNAGSVQCLGVIRWSPK